MTTYIPSAGRKPSNAYIRQQVEDRLAALGAQDTGMEALRGRIHSVPRIEGAARTEDNVKSNEVIETLPLPSLEEVSGPALKKLA